MMESEFGRFIDENDNEVFVWEVGAGDPETTELKELAAGSAWVFHILASNILDAARAGQDMISSDQMVLWLKLVGAYGVRAAPNVSLLPSSEWRKRRQERRGTNEPNNDNA